ncbi:MAG: 5-formyltetrahydrofolate cyclo-ligase [Duncaniella sp.]|nr:5-formyltetrahydrofolate cyclo-ligase [Duncaniella sp.]
MRITITKDDIRCRIRARKALLDDNERREAAERVFAMLEQTPEFMLADHILMYHSLPDELSTREFIDRWNARKHFYLPRVNGVNLDILPYDRSTLQLGAFHIEEPQGDNVTPVEAIDMIVIPAVAYDRNGNRLGRGKGFYDRLLASTKARKVGVAYDFQLIDDDIPVDAHDVPVDIVITESRFIKPRR